MADQTIPRMFEDSVSKYPDNPFMWEKKTTQYQATTYKEMQALVYRFANGLLELGIQKGDRIALISEGRNYWVMSELAILYVGAISVPISVKVDELSDLKFRLAHSGCRMVIVSAGHAAKVQKIKHDLPDLEKIILLDEMKSYDDDEVCIDDILKNGNGLQQSQPDRLAEIWQSITEKDYATISYTSGTTADPKGIILSHRNYTANVEQSSSLMDVPEEFTSLLILPWDHSFAHTAGIYTLMKNGASMASIQVGKTPMETLRNIPINIKEIKPHFLLSVPALAKNFRKNIEKGIRDKGPKIEKLFKRALKTAYSYNGEGWNRGAGLRKLRKPAYLLYDKILFSKIRESFGGRLQFFVGGGALLDIELQRFFYAIGIPMFQGYGLSESAPVISSNAMQRHKLGSSGFLVPDLDLKICDENGDELPVGQQGEIVVRGENIMVGYWKNDKATKEALRDGWLFTGDLGYMSEDGFLYVLGRSKSLLIGNDGEKYSPEGIEEALTDQSIYIDQVMLYNNQSPATVALLVPNRMALKNWLKEKQLTCQSQEGQDAVLKLLEEEINKYRDGGPFADMFPGRWLPSAVAVLGEGFTEQNRFLNTTLKMVRGKITEFYQNRIDFLFTPEASGICNQQNRMIISRLEQNSDE